MSDWFPIADEHDVIPRHVARSALHGHELVVWRADDGNVNVWENRCLHRGVRLSIGVNDGAELVCRYHAWRYANRSGGCTYIPAHPADSPPRTVQCLTFPVVERYGLVWTTLADVPDDAPEIVSLETTTPFVLRARPVRAAAEAVEAALSELVFPPSAAAEGGQPPTLTHTVSGSSIELTSVSGDHRETIVFFVQPVGPDRSIVRPVLAATPADPSAAWRHHAKVLGQLVETVEASAPPPVSLTSATETAVALPRRDPAPDRVAVRIARTHETAPGVVALDLEPVADVLPVFQAGDHIDLHLPNGLVRQYSLTNAPGETAHYRIGVKREPDSRGGSAFLHDELAVGDTLEISAPRNGFPLRRNVGRTILVAGGIGVTPILAMAQTLDRVGLGFELHHFVRSTADIAFRDVLEQLGDSVHHHVGLDADGTRTALAALLAGPDADAQIAACGPPPMLDLIRSVAADAGWPDTSVTFEYFENTNEIDQSSTFTVDLARSAIRVEVPAGVSMLDALRQHGVPIDSSCETGACGTCQATVLDGEPLHQDVYLNATERAAGDRVMTCVSRATSDRLVLDL